MPAKTATVDVTSAQLANFARPVLSSSSRIPNKPQPYPIGGAGKPEQRVIKALPSEISVANTRSTSSVALQTTRAPTGVDSVPAREVKDSRSRAAHEMAAYNVRLGDAYMEVGDCEKARSSYSRAVGGAPDSKEALDKMRRAERAKAAEVLR